MNAKFCTQCGGALGAPTPYCPNCGAPAAPVIGRGSGFHAAKMFFRWRGVLLCVAVYFVSHCAVAIYAGIISAFYDLEEKRAVSSAVLDGQLGPLACAQAFLLVVMFRQRLRELLLGFGVEWGGFELLDLVIPTEGEPAPFFYTDYTNSVIYAGIGIGLLCGWVIGAWHLRREAKRADKAAAAN